MKQLKLRAWDTVDQKMIYNFEKKIHLEQYLQDPRYIVMEQLVGIKTRLAQDVYDGDIIKWLSGALMVVSWINDPPSYSPFDGYLPQECEVVGNIHENPEMVKGKNGR